MAHLLTTADGENVPKKKIEYSQLKSVMNTRYGPNDWIRTSGRPTASPGRPSGEIEIQEAAGSPARAE